MNTLIKFDCPGCGQPMEGEPELEYQETTCSICGNKFFPKPFKAVEAAQRRSDFKSAPKPSPEEVAAATKMHEMLMAQLASGRTPATSTTEQIRGKAHNFTAAAMLFAVIGIAAVFVAIFEAVIEQGVPVNAVIVAAGCIGSAFWLYLIAQIIHIRANTEK